MQNNGRARRSLHINRCPAVNIHHARRYAAALGVPLNWMVTVNFGLAGIDQGAASLALQKLLAQRFAPWLRRSAANDNGLKPTYVWSLEAPHGSVSAHLLLHLPSHLVRGFQDRLRFWLEGLAGNEMSVRVIDIRPVKNIVGATRYILKGISETWGPHLAIRPVAQGQIVGKRSGFSRNLGPTARKQGGYRPKRHLI
jgi:hypothetical protein